MQKMNGYPCSEQGYEKGVSACFAGVIGDMLIVAGGCNFPDKPVSEGGKKKYYRSIYGATLHDHDSLDWNEVGMLPEAAAYGVSVMYENALIMIGGNNENHSLCTVLRVYIEDNEVKTDTLPLLPMPLDNMAGALVGHTIFVVGGNCVGKPSQKVWSLNMTNLAQGWQEEPSMPGIERVQPIAAAIDDRQLGVWGGFTPKTDSHMAALANEGIALSIGAKEWNNLPAPTDNCGEIVFTGGATAVNLPDGSTIVVGGVNKDVFLSALNHLPQGYLLHEPEWYRFNDQVLHYKAGKWHSVARNKAVARAGCALTYHKGYVYVIGGELKPGVRTPEIYRIKVSK